MMHFRRLSMACCAVLMFAAVALTGCLAQNNVRLLYNTSGTSALPVATAPRVTVVVFEDQRGRLDIGVRKLKWDDIKSLFKKVNK